MSIRESFPGDPGSSAAHDVAGLLAGVLAGIALPPIERFGSDNAALAGLDDCAAFGFSAEQQRTRASVARSVVAAGVLELEGVRVLENSLAARKAGLVDRVLGAVAVESAATGLSRYQAGVAETGCVAEIALALGMPERSAAALGAHAVELQSHPRTRAALDAGVLSWRHVCTVLGELGTLGETVGVSVEDAAVLESRLLVLAEGATASRFASKARRARELMFPDSLEARTKQAFRGRKISNDAGKDGMNWLELHIPTIAANAIMVHCTRAARAIKADAAERQKDAVARGTGEDCVEYRTMDQLRADVAAILLMGQELPDNARYTSPNINGNGNSCNNGNGSWSAKSGGAGGAGDPDGRDGGNGFSGGNGFWSGAAGRGNTDCSDSDQGHRPDGAFSATSGDAGYGGSTDVEVSSAPGQGVGFSPFGETSAVGVSLIDIEPPWAHALPSTQGGFAAGKGQESNPNVNTDANESCDTGFGDVAGHGPASTAATRGGVPPDGPDDEGSMAVAGTEDELAPLEGTIVSSAQPTGPGPGPEAGSGPPTGSGPDAGGPFMAADGDGGDVPVEGSVMGDGSGLVDGVVDGVPEKPAWELLEQEAYLEQLTRLGGHPVLADPPMPKVLALLRVSFLGLLGITDEPAELDDSTAGPVPLSIARKLLAGSSTFLRVLTDPVSGRALPLEPEQYTLRNSERSVLQALAGGCYFPNCPNPVMDTELDHLRAFEFGGQSTAENLKPSCRRHHRLKHFKDDKDRQGNYRRWAEPWRAGIRLRGWTPKLCSDGRVGWVSPSGTYRPPECTDPQRPAYPKWLKKRLARALATPETPDTPDTRTTERP